MNASVRLRSSISTVAALALLCHSPRHSIAATGTEALLRLCPRVFLYAPFEPALNEVERRLICGEPNAPAPYRGVWGYIPPAQAEFQLKASLQSRGYLQPKFYRESDQLFVEPGPLTYVTAVRTEGASELPLDIQRKRDWVGRKLTPEILDQTERWSFARLQNLGYPCPSVTAQGDPRTGVIHLSLVPGERLALKDVVGQPLDDLMPGTLRRYDAFNIGEPFQGDLLTITESRMIASQILQNVHLTVARCDPDGALVRQDVVLGAPRLLSFGFGVNTEGIFLIRNSWKNTRIGSLGSSLEFTTLASTREQDLTASADWYYLPYPTRIHFKPFAKLRHQNENFFEILSMSAQLTQSRSWDFPNLATSFEIGPKFEYVNTIRGAEQRNSSFFFLESIFSANSHYFEFHKTSPKTGFHGRAMVDLNSDALLSTVAAQRVVLGAEGLWNFKNYEPYLWILGMRGGFATTFTEERAPFDKLPPTLRQYLGGSTDLRGFGKYELPASGRGSLTSVFLDIESRFGSFLPFRLEPLVFVDLGLLGDSPFQLESTLYWSPGAGFRWESPIGVLRGTASHGFATGGRSSLSHWQFYLSLGEEF